MAMVIFYFLDVHSTTGSRHQHHFDEFTDLKDVFQLYTNTFGFLISSGICLHIQAAMMAHQDNIIQANNPSATV